MATAPSPSDTRTPSLADVVPDGIPLHRILLHPTPGTATEADAEAVLLRERRLCELVDGVLVEKAMGWYESDLACVLIQFLRNFVRPQRLGLVTGEGGTIKLAPKLIRIPDVAFFARARFPDGKRPTRPMPHLIPDLAVEILSESNTRAEMDRKLRDYFAAGIPLVWYLDPVKRRVAVYDAVDRVVEFDESGTLDGGPALPGFTLRVADWFDEAEL